MMRWKARACNVKEFFQQQQQQKNVSFHHCAIYSCVEELLFFEGDKSAYVKLHSTCKHSELWATTPVLLECWQILFIVKKAYESEMVEMPRMIVSSIMFSRHQRVIPPNLSTLSMYSTVSWIMSNAALLFHRCRRWLNKMESERGILFSKFETQSKCWPPCAKDSKSIANVIKGCFWTLDEEVRASIHWRTKSFTGKNVQYNEST